MSLRIISYCCEEMHTITWEILMHFKRRALHLCHGFLPVHPDSRANERAPSLTSAQLISLFLILLLSASSLTRRQKKKDTHCLISFSLTFSFSLSTGKHRVLPPSPTTNDKKVCSLFFMVYLSPLVCWINHFTPVINKRTNGWMPLPSDY